MGSLTFYFYNYFMIKMRYNKIRENPFGEISSEEIRKAEIKHTQKKAVTKQAPMEETDVEISAPLSAEDVKQLWRDWRERGRAKKEAILKGK